MNSKDPYADHRDSKGRFKKGNPGPRRGTPWLPENEVAKKWNFLIQLPPRCICGKREYRFRLTDNLFLARCINCRERLVYDTLADEWWKDTISY